MLRRQLLDAMLLARDHEHTAAFVALSDGLAHECVETADVALDAVPAEVCRRRGGARRFADQLEAGVAIECREQGVDGDQACRGAVWQLASRLLLHPEILDLGRVALRSGDEPLAPAVEKHDRGVEVVEERGDTLAAEVRKEEVEPLLVDARCQQLAVALPLLAHVLAQRAGIETGNRFQGSSQGFAAQVELTCRPHLRRLELCDRLLGRRVEGAQVLDIVAEPLRPPGTRAVNAEDIDDTAADREVPRHRDGAFAPVA